MKFCKDIHGAQRMKPTNFGDPLIYFTPAFLLVDLFDFQRLYTKIGWIAMKCMTNIHVTFTMNYNLWC